MAALTLHLSLKVCLETILTKWLNNAHYFIQEKLYLKFMHRWNSRMADYDWFFGPEELETDQKQMEQLCIDDIYFLIKHCEKMSSLLHNMCSFSLVDQSYLLDMIFRFISTTSQGKLMNVNFQNFLQEVISFDEQHIIVPDEVPPLLPKQLLQWKLKSLPLFQGSTEEVLQFQLILF